MSHTSHPAWLRYGAAPATVAIAVVLRLVLMSVLGLHIPLLFLWPAVHFAAWYGSLRPGLVATLLSVLIAAAWLVRPLEDYQAAD